MNAGRTAFDRGDLEGAARYYEAALSRGKAMDDAAAIADAAYNLAACRVAQGKPEAARALLHEARAETARTGPGPGDLLLLEARVAWLLGEADAALSLTDRILSSPRAGDAERLHLQARLLRGEIACSRGDAGRAAAERAAAGPPGTGRSTPALDAGRSRLAGCILLLEKDPLGAARQFDREADLLREAGHYGTMAEALRRSGEAFRAAARAGEAADRWFRAARSLHSRGDLPRARDLAARALDAAGEANDGALGERTRSLLEEIAAAEAPR